MTSKKIIHTLNEPDNHIYAMDFKPDGEKFVTGGRDCNIRLYDENKISKFVVFGEGYSTPIHKNRVYAVKFLHDNPNVVISGGWDRTILLWDLRTARSEGFLYGPMVCGDSLDYRNGIVLSGSWRNEDQLEIFDLKMMKRIKILEWEEFEENSQMNRKSYVYTCQFEKNFGEKIVAGSTGNNEIRVFDVKQDFKCVDGLRDLEQGIFSLDWDKNGKCFVYGGGEGLCGLISKRV